MSEKKEQDKGVLERVALIPESKRKTIFWVLMVVVVAVVLAIGVRTLIRDYSVESSISDDLRIDELKERNQEFMEFNQKEADRLNEEFMRLMEQSEQELNEEQVEDEQQEE